MHSWRFEFGAGFAGRRVLVTGSTGFVGAHLCTALSELGADVYGVARGRLPPPADLPYPLWQVDLADPNGLTRLVRQVQPQLVFHLAGLVSAEQGLGLVQPMCTQNLLTTVNLLAAVADQGCQRIILVGSSEEMGSPEGEFTSPYAVAKACAQFYGRFFRRSYGLPVALVRPFMTYGPRQSAVKLIPYTITSLLREKPPQLSSGERVADFVYVADVVRGLLQTAAWPDLIEEPIDLGTGLGTPLRYVANLLVSLTGSGARPVFGAVPDRAGVGTHIANAARTARLIDWRPRQSLEDGLLETVRWYRKEVDRVDGEC